MADRVGVRWDAHPRQVVLFIGDHARVTLDVRGMVLVSALLQHAVEYGEGDVKLSYRGQHLGFIARRRAAQIAESLVRHAQVQNQVTPAKW
jgi:hypothetical protein